MNILCVLGGMAIGSIVAIVCVAKEYQKCADALDGSREELENYRRSNRILLDMINRIREEKAHEQA